ncbi:hypothetical protein [Pseudomonas soli]|uniref:hypothetical protein n=1 Tax=Pseudomonas soli TaxID=1306993 RepID=UPI001427C456
MNRSVVGGTTMTAAERKKARNRPAMMSAEAMDRVAAECYAYFSARAAERAAVQRP